MSCGIYIIENLVNHKIYVGQSIRIEKRWYRHRTDGRYLKDSLPIHRAIHKYGVENFSFKIIEKCEKNQAILDERERYWIQYYDSLIPNGYNVLIGGCQDFSSARRKAVNQYDLKGKFIKTYPSIYQASEETGISDGDISMLCKTKKGARKNFQWRYADDEDLQLETNFNNLVHSSGTKIHQYDLNGELINIFNTLDEAAEAVNICKSLICSVCKGKGHTAGGYQWRYENEPLDLQYVHKNSKKVNQYDKNTKKLIKTYPSVSRALTAIGKKPNDSGIANCCNGRSKTAYGYIWKYVEEEEKENNNKEKGE